MSASLARYFSTALFTVLGLSGHTEASAETCENVTMWQRATLDEDELLISLLRVNGRPVSPAFEVFPIEDTYLVPLSSLEDLFRLGWQINDNPSSLSSNSSLPDINHCSFIINFAELQSATGFYWTQDDFDTYIDINALPHLIGGSVEYNFNLLQLNFSTATDLPGLKTLQGYTIPTLTARSEVLPDKTIDDQYFWFSPPLINYQLNGNYNSENKTGNITGSVNSFFDLANHATELRISASDSSSRQFLRFSKNLDVTGDRSAQNFLRYEVGDLQLQSDELISRAKQALGVSVFNFDPKFSRSFSQVTIEETVLPGWRAQLFRNGQFLEETTTDQDNRVVFEQVDTFYGSNLFEIKLYGPEGQQEVREQTINVGKDQLNPGGFNYYFSVSDSSRRFIDNDLEKSQYDKNITGLLSYGINKNLTVEASTHSLSGQELQQDFVSSAVYLNVAGIASKTQFVKDIDGGNAIFTGINSRIGKDFRANFSARYFDDFVSEAYPESIDLKGEARLQLNGRANFFEGINWSASLTHRSLSERTDINQASFSVGKNLYGGTFSSSLQYNDNDADSQFRHRIYYAKDFNGWYISNSLDWSPDDNQKIDSFVSNIRWPQQYAIYNESRLEYRANSEDKYLFRHRFNWRQERVNLQFGASVTDGGDWTFNLGISGDIEYDPFEDEFNFYRPRGGSTANIHALAYLDNNRNAVFDEDDDVLSDVAIGGNTFWRNSFTNEQGQVQLSTNTRRQSLRIEEASLPSPFMLPADELVYIKTHRGGLNKVDLPVLTFNDLEGAIYRVKNDKSRGASRLNVQLLNLSDELIAETETESDGFFFFTRIPPGEYRLQLEQSYLDKHNLSIANLPKSISASTEGDSLRLNDLLLVDNDELETLTSQLNEVSTSYAPSNFYVQLGAFKKPRSIIEVIQHLPTEEYDLKIFRSHATGLSYVVMGGYLTIDLANQAIDKIRHIAQFTEAYINNGDRYFSAGWTLEYQLQNIAQHLENSQLHIEQANPQSYFCQLASYRSLTSIGEGILNGIESVYVVRRNVNKIRFYSLYTGPVAEPTACQIERTINITPETPFAIQTHKLQDQLVQKKQ